jgi:hypothetical protein
VNWAAFISVFFISATKFLFAPSVSIYYFSFWETILFVSIGGIAGVSFFYFFAGWLIEFNHKRRLKKEALLRSQGKPVIKKVFTPFRRRIIRIKKSFGLIGIAIVTPCIISIPIGSVIAARFYHHKPQTIFVLYLFVIIWAFVLTYFNDIIAGFIRG